MFGRTSISRSTIRKRRRPTSPDFSRSAGPAPFLRAARNSCTNSRRGRPGSPGAIRLSSAVRAVGVPGPAQPDTNNWAPRFGFAYSPTAKTSIRGGFGMSYDVLFYNIVASAASNYPRVVTQTTAGPAIANQYPALAPKVATVPPLNPLASFTNTPGQVQNPTVNFWNLSIQRELARNYVLE